MVEMIGKPDAEGGDAGMSEAIENMSVEKLLWNTRMYPGCVSASESSAELGRRVKLLSDEVARLTRRAGDLEGRFKMVGKYMGNGRMQQAHDLVKDTIVAICMTEPKQAALTPQAGKGSNHG